MSFSPAFFEVTAQLLPLLFLAMVVEDKLQPDDSETPLNRVIRSWVIALLVISEVLALSAVAGGLQPSSTVGSLVASTMLVAAMLIVVPVLERELQSDRGRWERRSHLLAGLTFVVGILATFVAMAVS